MEAITIEIPMSTEVQSRIENVLKNAGLTIQTAITAFLQAIVKNGEMPYLDDPFYSEENMAEIIGRIDDIESGKVQLIDMSDEFEEDFCKGHYD